MNKENKPTLKERKDYIHLEDFLVSRVEPILIKYKDSLKSDPKMDYRNFAAFEIVRMMVNLLKEELEGLTVIGDKDMLNAITNWDDPNENHKLPLDVQFERAVQAQLSHTIKELKDKLDV